VLQFHSAYTRAAAARKIGSRQWFNVKKRQSGRGKVMAFKNGWERNTRERRKAIYLYGGKSESGKKTLLG
jgi:hypothetical protein